MRYLSDRFLTLIVAIVMSGTTHAMIVKTNLIPDGAREKYPIHLLEAAFSYFPDEEFVHQQYHENVNHARLQLMVQEGSLDIMWAGTTPELERDFIPIRVPLFKGLLGHRIFIIRKGDEEKFSRITQFSDLLRLKAGQGRNWGDTQILESAGINVVKPVNYPNLFHMLDGERFDYFPRAVHEPWPEVSSRPELNLSIEEKLMLVYPMPLYFFVSKHNQQLADILIEGLNRAVDDGTFNQLFLNNEDIKTAIELTNMKDRRVFRVSNPNLSPETPLDDERLWFDINQL